MPNHFHFLLIPKNGGDEKSHPLSRKIGTLLSSYTQALNLSRERTGSLFQQKTKGKYLSEEPGYDLRCF
ncbi:MAG: hypothetical protein AAFQ98_23340, partial [Bacteroidota bacterium]